MSLPTKRRPRNNGAYVCRRLITGITESVIQRTDTAAAGDWELAADVVYQQQTVNRAPASNTVHPRSSARRRVGSSR